MHYAQRNPNAKYIPAILLVAPQKHATDGPFLQASD